MARMHVLAPNLTLRGGIGVRIVSLVMVGMALGVSLSCHAITGPIRNWSGGSGRSRDHTPGNRKAEPVTTCGRIGG